MDKFSLWPTRGLYFDKPDENGGADDKQGDADPGKDSEGKNGDPGGKDPEDGEKKKKIEFSKEQQTYIDELVKSRYGEAKARADKEHEEAQARKDEEAKAKHLEEQGEFEKLATERQTRIEVLEAENATLTADLETVKAAHDAREDVIRKILDERRKDLPRHIIALLDDQDSLKQLEYLTENAEALQKDNGSGKGTPGKRGKKPPKGGTDTGEKKRKKFHTRLPKA